MRKAKAQAQAKAAQAEAQKKSDATFFAEGEKAKPAEQQTYAVSGSEEITTERGEDNQPQNRPPIAARPLRTFFDTSALGPVSPLSTHRAQYEATPHAQAKRAAEVAAKRDEQNARAITGLEWLMSKLTGGK